MKNIVYINIKLLFVSISFALLTSAAMATEYFVAPSSSGDGSKVSPFGTIKEALNVAQPHDIITLRAGTYSNASSEHNNIAHMIDIPNLTIQGYPNEKPHIKIEYGSGKDIAFYIRMNADNVVLKNLEISGGDIYTIQTESNFDYVSASERDAAKGLIIDDCEVHHSGTDIIKLSAGSDDAKILNSDIHHSCMAYVNGDLVSEYANCQGIDNVNSDRMIIRGNHIHNISYDDTDKTGTNPALFFKGGARDVIVERNLIENAYAGIWVGGQTDIDFYSPEDNPAPHYNSFNGVVRNNIIKNMRGDCISIISAKDPKIYNNTMLNCGSETGGTSIKFWQQPTYMDIVNPQTNTSISTTANNPTVNALVVNNLTLASDASEKHDNDRMIEVRGHNETHGENRDNVLAVADGTLKMDYNIYWDKRYTDLKIQAHNRPWIADASGGYSGDLFKYNTLVQWQGSPLHNVSHAEQHTIYANPMVDVDGKLLEGSLAIGSGIAVDGLTEDYYGNVRSGTVDIGAVSYGTNTTTSINGIVYENAEDSSPSRWSIYDTNPNHAEIKNIFDEDSNSRVIALTGNGTENGYILGDWSGENAWDNRTNKIISWKMKYNEPFYIFISLLTDEGHRYLYYTADETNYGIEINKEYVHYGLGSQIMNGEWHTITRNLQKDISALESPNKIKAINAFLVRGSGLIDNVLLKNK